MSPRPSLVRDEKRVNFTISLTQEQSLFLRKEAARIGVSVGFLIRRAIEEFAPRVKDHDPL